MFKPEGFSLDIFKSRYAFTEEESWEEFARRVAVQMAKAEAPEKQKEYEQAFFEIIASNEFVPGGRICYNSGRVNAQLLNCFVLGDQLDSKEGWGKLAKEMIITSMTGGGCGSDFSDVRPRGASINGQKGSAPGPVELMKLINGCAAPIRAGGQRRVALMFSLDLHHPDIMEFLDAKLTRGELTYANVSVRCHNSTEFKRLVEEDGDFELHWKGLYKRTVKARELWAKIVENAWKSAEPGFLNWELAESESNIYYIERLSTTNPSLRAGTKVITSGGIFPIEELEGKKIVVKNLNGKLSNAECFLSGRNKQMYKIKLSTGFEYFCTPEHKWPLITKTGIKKVETTDIKVGDTFPALKQESLFEGSLGSYEDGFIIGWLYGDGWITDRRDSGTRQYGFIVSAKDQQSGVHIRIRDYLKSLTGKDYLGSNSEGNIEFNVSDSRIDTHFRSFGVDKKELGLPSSIWKEGTEELRKGFIDGLFSSDGHVGASELRRITFTSSKYKLFNDVSELLGFYGIKTSRCASTASPFDNDKAYDRYDLTINARVDIQHFRKIFQLSVSHKQERLNSFTWNSKREMGDHVTVVDIQLTEEKEDVWDISVYDTTHCFQLSHCITGNCGEICMSSYDSCDLGHLVLTRFIHNGRLMRDKLAETIRKAVRFLDNVLTVNTYPMPEMQAKSHQLRRIGLGTTGLADALAMLGLKYGSDEGNAYVDELFRFISKVSYEASIMLAIEKGPFPSCDRKKHVESGFIKRMPKKIKSLILEHGIRNCAILTQAPTGTVSIVSDNCSSGVEPMFAPAYERRFFVGNERKVETVFHPLFAKFMKEGKSVDHFVGAMDLSVQQHLEMQKTVQKHIDNAVSKTINMSEHYSVEDMSKVWLEYLPSLKGTTFYRDNSRKYIDDQGVEHEPPLKAIPLEEAKQRFFNDALQDVAEVVDCPKGVCEI